MNEIPTITKRRLQAAVIAPLYREMASQLGQEQAQAILDAAIRKAAVSEAKEFAANTPGGQTSLRTFTDLFRHWSADGALEIEVHRADDERFDFDVTRCRYAEMYREMGIGDIGHLLSCNRDGVFCDGYDANIKLERNQTIMSGARCCTFRYHYQRNDDASS